MKEVYIYLICGLILYLFSIRQLSTVLEDAFTENVKNTLSHYTKRIFSALLLGIATTILLGSSSAVIIITIVFVNTKSLTFRQAMGIVLGANLGTTFSSKLIAFDFSKYSIVPLIIGLIIFSFSKNEKIKKAGEIMLYLGMLFFALFIMEEAVSPLKESDVFEEWILKIENHPLQGALIGGLITLIIQSSSATVGMAIVLGKQNLISIAGGIALMIGAELGTCFDTTIATINGSRQAVKTGLFHLLFNLISIIVGLILFTPYVKIIDFITVKDGIEHHIANAHMFFSFAGVILFLPFVSLFEKFLNYLIPDKA